MPPPRIKRSNTASAVPASLEDGEIAINQADGKLYYHTAAGGVSTFLTSSHKATHATGGSDALSAADIGALTQATADSRYVNVTGDTLTGGLTINAATPLTVSGGRSSFAANGEPYGVGVKYVSSGGAVYFGATDGTATPGAQISQAGGVALMSFTNAGAASIPGTLSVGGTAVVVSSDSRLTDARTPTSHKATHATGGSDALTPADIGAVSVGGVVVASAGAVNAPSYTFTGDTNTGIFSPGADQLHIVTGGVSRITVSAAGLVATAGDLSCLGTLRASAGLQTSGGRALFRAVNEAYAVGSAYSLTSGFVYFGAANESDTPDAQISGGGGVALMYLQNGGNVGIGTTSPTISSGTGLHCAGSTMRLGASRTPASSTATGNTGEICWDSSYLYVCVNTNAWRRIPHSTW